MSLFFFVFFPKNFCILENSHRNEEDVADVPNPRERIIQGKKTEGIETSRVVKKPRCDGRVPGNTGRVARDGGIAPINPLRRPNHHHMSWILAGATIRLCQRWRESRIVDFRLARLLRWSLSLCNVCGETLVHTIVLDEQITKELVLPGLSYRQDPSHRSAPVPIW